MSRFIFFAAAIFTVCAVSDCEAQRTRLINRFATGASTSGSRTPSLAAFHRNQSRKFDTGAYSTYRNPVVSRILDGPVPPTKRDPIENNFRYIGGFHQSHFDNVGIPSGDIGIRGNAYNWNTW
jgi:hypothetical protein